MFIFLQVAHFRHIQERSLEVSGKFCCVCPSGTQVANGHGLMD